MSREAPGATVEPAVLPGSSAPTPDEWQPNLSWVTAQLAVGGSFPPERIDALAGQLSIRAVVDLRSEACDDEAALGRHGIAFLHLPTPDHAAVDDAMLITGVAFVNRYIDAGERVLIHCEHGIGRSAMLTLCVLVSRGYAPLEALEHAKSRRWLVSPSPAQYEAWRRWLQDWASRQPVPWDLPSFDEFKAIAYRHLQDGAGS